MRTSSAPPTSMVTAMRSSATAVATIRAPFGSSAVTSAGRRASLGLENAIADDAENRGDGHAAWSRRRSASASAPWRRCARPRDRGALRRPPTDRSWIRSAAQENWWSPPTEAGERLDRVLAARVAELSRSRLKALILAGDGRDRRPHDPRSRPPRQRRRRRRARAAARRSPRSRPARHPARRRVRGRRASS